MFFGIEDGAIMVSGEGIMFNERLLMNRSN